MSDELFKNCITVINELFSINESIKFLEKLHKIEEKAVNKEYKNFESFSVDIIPLLKQQSSLNSQIHSTVPENYCNKAIYNYYQFDSNSTLYALNITPHCFHEPLLQSFNKIDGTVLPRLYIKHNKHLLKEIKENTTGMLALFSDLSRKPLDGNDDDDNSHNNSDKLYYLTGNVMIVHPLGDYYRMNNDLLFDGWIKVKVVRSARVKSVLPGTFLDDGFILNDTGTLKKIGLPQRQNTLPELTMARNNEIIRRFISKVTASCTDSIQLYPTPIQHVDSLIPLSDSLLTPTSESASKSSIETTWKKLEQFCTEKFAKIVDISEYIKLISEEYHARGHFKRVFFIDDKKTLQLFYKCTTFQKVTELASYLALKNTECIGNMTEMIAENGQPVGLTMDKYDMTLHHYIKHEKNLTAAGKYNLIQQMWKSLVTIHRRGIAHRDLSSHNFMIKIVGDDVKLYLIDFGKAVFFRTKDAQHWWVDSNESHVYQDELKPINEEELNIWCKSLPYIMSKPDHGHRLYRSIQTLPKNSDDHLTLPYLIDPVAEDVYSLGVMTWSVFSDKLPWPGVFDTDLKQIRNTVISPWEIERLIRKEVPGSLSKYILLSCLRPNPLERQSAEQILEWLDRPSNKRNLISEWEMHHNNSRKRQRR